MIEVMVFNKHRISYKIQNQILIMNFITITKFILRTLEKNKYIFGISKGFLMKNNDELTIFH